jgi:hypothetical protein
VNEQHGAMYWTGAFDVELYAVLRVGSVVTRLDGI